MVVSYEFVWFVLGEFHKTPLALADQARDDCSAMADRPRPDARRMNLGRVSRGSLAGALADAASAALLVNASIWLRRGDADVEGPYPSNGRVRRFSAVDDDRLEIAVRGAIPRLLDVHRLVFDGQLQGLLTIVGGPPRQPLDVGRVCEEIAAQIANFRLLEGLRGREAELEAMLETAEDLSSEHHVQNVLEAIVARARRLLRSDTAYLTLVHGAMTRVRVTLGTRTEEFARVILAPGEGLGGLVAERRAAYYTPDYLADARFEHTAVIDRAVRGEGLRSILGVPMMASGELLGVLFIANRRSRTSLNERHVAVLQGLADHAALALRNAQLLEEAEDAAERFQRLHELARAQNDALIRASQVHDRLTQLVLEDRGLDEIVAALADSLSCNVELVDVAGTVVAGSHAAAGELSRLAPSGLAQLARARTVVDERHRVVCVPIAAGRDSLAFLVLDGTPDEHHVRAAEQGARAVALVMVKARAVFDADERLRGEFFDELLLGHAPAEYLLERGRRLGIDIRSPHRLAVSDPHTEGTRLRLLSNDAGWRQPSVAAMVELPYRNRLVYFIPIRSQDETASERAAELVHHLRERGWATCRLALSPTCVSIADYARHFSDALRCLEVSAVVDHDAAVVTPESLGAYYILVDARREPHIREFVERVLGGLVDYDRRGGALLATLETFFDLSGNLSKAAAALYVHPNTLYYRLHRIRRLTNLDPRAGADAFQLQLALQLRKATATSPSGSAPWSITP